MVLSCCSPKVKLWIIRRPASSLVALQKPFQGQRTVVLLVPCRVDQGDGALLNFLLQQLDGLLFLFQFFPVALLELLPLGRVMAEPFAQLRARGYLLQPQVHRRTLLGQAARPQPFHQDSQAIVARGLFVRSLELELALFRPQSAPPGDRRRRLTRKT